MDQKSHASDRPVTKRTGGAVSLPLLITGLYRPPVTSQHDVPVDPKQPQNWLPAPKEGFRFTARLNGPYMPLIDGSYNVLGVVRVD